MSDTRLAEAATLSFARHETFAPRFGWLHKAYIAISNDTDVFLQKDASVVLGVGKNMVNAIRYWAYAFKLTIEHPKGGASRAFVAAPTWEACWLLDENGADPYLEDPSSLWLLHWWLLSPVCYAPTWWVAFHALPSSRFSESELADFVARHVRLAGWEMPAAASILKDVDCLTKMYAPRKTPTGSPGSFEDLLDCPFRELGLLEAVEVRPGEGRTWRFTSTTRSTLPSRVIAYACLDYAGRHTGGAGSVSLARLANEPGGPGRAFRLREPELAAALEEVYPQHPQITVADAVGQRSLVFTTNPSTLAWNVLDAHYSHVRNRIPTKEQWLADHKELDAELQRRQRATKPPALAKEIP